MSDSPRPARDSAKQRSRRIPLDYYKGLTRLEVAKWLLTALACAAAGGYVLWALVGWLAGSHRPARQFSPGPVAASHVVWDGQCAACHVSGTNLRSDAVAVSLVAATVAGRAQAGHAAGDSRCQTCHAGPPHHANQLESEVRSCAGCHHDHQGQNADLNRVADSVCTACHSDIQHHRRGPSILGGSDVPVTSFPADHPPFRSLTAGDPGRLIFNHKLHMLPGQFARGAEAKAKKTLADIPPEYRAGLVAPQRLEDVPLTSGVMLRCEYCHQPDASTTPAVPQGGQSVPALGAYMQPISFARHCAACHSGELVADVEVAGTTVARQLPHGLKAGAIQQILAGLASPPSGESGFTPRGPVQPIPGKTPGANLAQTTESASAARVKNAAGRLTERHRCGKCHEIERAADQMPAMVPPGSPAVWLRHARFDHAAHRAVQCYDCHDRERLFARGEAKPDLDDKTPLIPDRDTCKNCHAPIAKSGSAGARYDCAECHRYHGGDLPPHGRGAVERGVPPGERSETDQWLSRELFRARPVAPESTP